MSPLARLRPRERDVLALVARGLGNAAIGARLCVAVGTVGKDLIAIYRALGVRNRTEAARVYWRERG